MDRPVKSERNGWRDETISRRHRDWGYDCPALDLDWLVIEYDAAIPVALVEYKNENARMASTKEANYRALIKLGDMSGLPVFAVRYASDLSWFRVTALNCVARGKVPDRSQKMTELEYVTLLYKLRDRELPIEVARKLFGWTDDEPWVIPDSHDYTEIPF